MFPEYARRIEQPYNIATMVYNPLCILYIHWIKSVWFTFRVGRKSCSYTFKLQLVGNMQRCLAYPRIMINLVSVLILNRWRSLFSPTFVRKFFLLIYFSETNGSFIYCTHRHYQIRKKKNLSTFCQNEENSKKNRS